jgi:ATP-dependent exoDNAse (exonuclease V) beta subunit
MSEEFAVVQGVVDLAVILPEEIWVVDFKTDHLNASELAEKTHNYQRQLRLYARALRHI